MLILVCFTALLYIVIIASFFIGWLKLPSYKLLNSNFSDKITVLIAYRNEEKHLPHLLSDLKNQDYPKDLLEIILINDHSTDRSEEITKENRSENILTLNLSPGETGKKAALRKGMEICNGQLIVTTDADCSLPPRWISAIAAFYRQFKPKMIVGPVSLTCPKNIAGYFQHIEFLSLQGSTAGAIAIGHPVMCNGANMAFTRECLPIIRETYQNQTTSSGDDIFALLAIKKMFGNEIMFLKSREAIVKTAPSETITGFFNQRKRWSKKAKFYTDSAILTTGVSVLLMNALLLVLFIVALTGNGWKYFTLLIILKSCVDFPFLFSVSKYYSTTKNMFWFPVIQSFYFLYVTITFVASLIGQYTWKSRKIST